MRTYIGGFFFGIIDLVGVENQNKYDNFEYLVILENILVNT